MPITALLRTDALMTMHVKEVPKPRAGPAPADPADAAADRERSAIIERMARDLLRELPPPAPDSARILARQVARSVTRLDTLDALMDAAVLECPRTLLTQMERLTRLRELEARVLQRCTVALEMLKAGLVGVRTVAVVPGAGSRHRRGRAA